MTPTRRAIMAAGAGTLALSLVLSIAPALAAGNSGTLKLYDGQDNDISNRPQVCTFYGRYDDAAPGAATWQLLTQPGGDVVEGGAYDGTGPAVTTTMSPTPGRYRLEWVPAGGNAKSKTLTVGDTCSSQSTPSEEASPSQEQSPSEQASSSEEASPSQESSPSQAASPSEGALPDGEEAEGATPTPAPTPEQDVQAGNPTDGSQPDQDQTTGPEAGEGGMLPDTSIPVAESGVLATIGLLLIIAAHAGSRRERQLPVA